MLIVRKLFLLIAIVGTVMAFSASGASAITVTSEPSGTQCPALTTSGGGCVVHGTGEVLLQGHVFGVESTAVDCVIEFYMNVNSSGVIKIPSVSLTHHTSLTDCTRTPCNLSWDGTLTGSFGAFSLNFTLCVLNGTTQQTCTVSIPITQSGHTYGSSFHVTATANTNAPGCEFEGQIAFEGTSVELN
jgi:hypothetical protein